MVMPQFVSLTWTSIQNSSLDYPIVCSASPSGRLVGISNLTSPKLKACTVPSSVLPNTDKWQLHSLVTWTEKSWRYLWYLFFSHPTADPWANSVCSTFKMFPELDYYYFSPPNCLPASAPTSLWSVLNTAIWYILLNLKSHRITSLLLTCISLRVKIKASFFPLPLRHLLFLLLSFTLL